MAPPINVFDIDIDKCKFFQDSTPDPAGGAYSAPSDPLACALPPRPSASNFGSSGLKSAPPKINSWLRLWAPLIANTFDELDQYGTIANIILTNFAYPRRDGQAEFVYLARVNTKMLRRRAVTHLSTKLY